MSLESLLMPVSGLCIHNCILYKVSSDQTVHADGVYSIVYFTQLYIMQSLLRTVVYYHLYLHMSRGSGAVYSDENCILCVLIHCIVYIVHSRDPYTSSLEKRDLYSIQCIHHLLRAELYAALRALVYADGPGSQ